MTNFTHAMTVIEAGALLQLLGAELKAEFYGGRVYATAKGGDLARPVTGVGVNLLEAITSVLDELRRVAHPLDGHDVCEVCDG